tara:strand:+ start:5502 stop:6101 length:600 start_codon:yes stop_codon:yes gene_type:complete
MIKFQENNNADPYKMFRKLYKSARDKGQKNIEAICISSYDANLKEVQARFVNLKYVKNEEWIFFTNYNSPKAKSFKSCKQIAANFFWASTYTQVRIKAYIKKTDCDFSDTHFNARSIQKNALAVSSDQSQKIESYSEVKSKYLKTLNNANEVLNRPEYWGGFSFKPFYFEFWHGNDERINERTVFEHNKQEWIKYILQP